MSPLWKEKPLGLDTELWACLGRTADVPSLLPPKDESPLSLNYEGLYLLNK